MGCTSSKVDSEETVRRCRDRRRLMKEAVQSRHHLAAAHSDYLRSLRFTGSALSAFASFQSHLSVSPELAGPVFLPRPPSGSRRHSSPPAAAPQAPFSPTTPSPTITSSKMPHILSESSPASTPEISERRSKSGRAAAAAFRKFPYLPENSTYATTPSQASSAWDWEKYYPPSPPDSEFFERRQKERERQELEDASNADVDSRHHLPDELDSDAEDGETDSDSGADLLRRPVEGQEEVQCGDWRGRCSTSSSSSLKSEVDNIHRDEDRGGDDDADSRSERIPSARSELRSASIDRQRHPSFSYRHHHHFGRGPSSEFGFSSATGMSGRKGTTVMSSSSSEAPEPSVRQGMSGGDDNNILKMVVRHKDLKGIVEEIEEYFVKAAAAGKHVSDLLEIGRAQFDHSFRQLKKTVYHSNSVLSNLSASWTSKPPLAIRYRLDTATGGGESGQGSHCSTLERLLTWEKKLYKEVKDREGVKIEHEKKLSALQSLERRGRVDEKLAKTKASIARLHSHILVTSQAVSTTSSAIVKVRDNELAPQLLKLCYGLMNMWRAMNELHEGQNHIVQQVRGLVNHSAAVESTSDLLRQATRDLESAISAWHSSFTRIVKHHRDYVRSLYGWLKLTQVQVGNADDGGKDHYSSLVSAELCAFCDEWKQSLERLPDTVASEAIKSFASVVRTISVKQAEELKIKKRAEGYSRELEKKTLALRGIEKKYYSYSTVGIGLPDGADGGPALDMRDPLVDKKAEIAACRRKVEEEMGRHVNAIKVTREMTLNSIQTGLPGVFQAVTGFSGLFAEALEGVCRQAAGRFS